MKVLKNTLRVLRLAEPESGSQIDLDGDLQIELTADEMISFAQSGDPSELVNEVCGHELHCVEAKLTNGTIKDGKPTIEIMSFIFDLEILQWEIV